ncbi:MAG TPA: hypothetical protein DCP90_08050 [Clostridiales bacterium]|nr:MAG: hypothetical protein A2Y22_00180 [Clostridiales bacterium GWD2_32_59]HAN10544.1 hypothetical protein [Clostridiales bacterium]
MKRQNIINLIVVLFIGLATTAFAASIDPGSEQDPIVTQSYVDSKISELKKEIPSSNNGTIKFTYEPLKINKNVQILGKQGTEIIVRSGETKAITIIKDGIENGLQDITDGVDIKKDKKVPLNHLIIIPREDGRGIKFTTDGYIMVRGEYTIKR